MTTPSSLESLIEALRCLPGIGPKSAQRMAYYHMQRVRPGAQRLADALQLALGALRHCERCNTFTEAEICDRCSSAKRDASLLCVVETPVDMNMMEQTHAYSGLYYVLMGRVSPLDGIGPRELRLERTGSLFAKEILDQMEISQIFTTRRKKHARRAQ